MPRNALHVCFYLCLLFSCVFAANVLDNHQTITHDNSNIKYSSVATGLGHGDCTRVPSPCDNKWWVQPNEGGNAAQFATTHTTAKGSASLTFTFSGSRAISIVGKRDSSVTAQVTLNGQQYAMTGQNEPELFRTENLSASQTYTLKMTFGGQGFLSIAALYIEASGRPGAPTSNPAPPPAQTTPKPPVQQPPPPTSQQPPPQPPPTQSSKPTPTQTQPPGAGGGADNPTSSPGGTTPPPNAPTDTPPNDSPSNPSDPDAPPGDSSAGSGSGGTTTPESANAPTVGRPQSPSETAGGGGDLTDPTDPAAAPTETEGAGRPRGHHDNSALIGGIVSGVLVFLLLLGLAAWYVRRWIRARRAPSYAYRNGPGKFDVTPFTAGAGVPAEPLPSNWQGFHDEGAAGPEMAERAPLERQQTAESRMGIAV